MIPLSSTSTEAEALKHSPLGGVHDGVGDCVVEGGVMGVGGVEGGVAGPKVELESSSKQPQTLVPQKQAPPAGWTPQYVALA